MKRMVKVLAAISLLTAMCFAYGCKPNNPDDNEEEYIDISGDGTCDGYEYVDLSLPSGILWATCNVGAGSPEGFGRNPDSKVTISLKKAVRPRRSSRGPVEAPRWV